MAFRKGQSGNPAGRPKEDPELKALARAQTPAAIKTLTSVMLNKRAAAAARVAAANSLLDRGYGKAAQSIEVSGELIHRMPDDELDRRITELIAQAGIAGVVAGENSTSEPAQNPHLLS